jgi:hypothetical protein
MFYSTYIEIPNVRSLKEYTVLGVGYLLLIIIYSGSAAQRGLWPPHSRGFLITHNDAQQSVGPLWTSDQLIAETST